MPLVRIEMLRGKSREYRAQVGEIVYQSMVDVLNVPLNDRFQVITEHDPDTLIFDRQYLAQRSDDSIFIQITLSIGRSVELKQRFYSTVAERLHESLNVRKEDVFLNLVEVAKENWSFGNGVAQYVTATSR